VSYLDLESLRPLLGSWTEFIGDLFYTDEMRSVQADIEARYKANRTCCPHNQDFFHQFRVTPIDKLKVIKITKHAVDNRVYSTNQGFMFFAMELSHEQKQDHTFWRRFTDIVISRLTAYPVLFWPCDHLAEEFITTLHAENIVPKGQGLDYVNKWVLDTYGAPLEWNELKQLS